MKKLLTVLLLLGMLFTMLVPAGAAEQTAEISVGKSDGAALDESLTLNPGEIYYFPILLTQNGETRPMNMEDLNEYDLRVNAVSGSYAMQTAGYVESGRKQHLMLEGLTGLTETAVVTYTVSLHKKGESKALDSVTVSWKVGFSAISDEALGAAVVIDNKTPVLTAAQLLQVQQAAGTQRAVFSGKGWKFGVKLQNQGATSFSYSTSAIAAVTEKWPEGSFFFLSFAGKPKFANYGTLTFELSEMTQEQDEIYLYRYLDGYLWRLGYSENEDEKSVAIQTNQLGSYVFSNLKIPNGTLVGGLAQSGTENNTAPDEPKENPTTGGAQTLLQMAVLGAAAGCR